MINTVRIWTKKPSRTFFAAIEKEEREPKPSKEAKPRAGILHSFCEMWENQANLVIRNLDND